MSKPVFDTPILSTGDPSTLKVWRQLCVFTFGEDSKAVKFLDEKIAEQGEDEPVLASEAGLLQTLAQLHFQGEQEKSIRGQDA